MEKKCNCRRQSLMRLPRKIFLVMKITFILILVGVLQLSASVYSQNLNLSLDLKNCSIKEVLKKIEDKSEYRFLYNEQFIDLSRKVSVTVEGKKIENILDEIFAGANISFKVMDNNLIVITPAEKSQSQKKNVTGKVTDSSGLLLPGVTIILKGTSTGIITDVNGSFNLFNVPDNGILIFSFVGMKSQEIAINGKSVINVVMQEETVSLDEVVAVGYGTQKKVNLTGAVSQVTAKQLENRPISSVTQMLQGTIPNVSVNVGSGSPGTTGSIKIGRAHV